MEMTPEQAEQQKDVYRGISDDMSPAAISRRLQIVGGLYRLGRQLYRAGRLHRGEPPEDIDGFIRRVAELPEE